VKTVGYFLIFTAVAVIAIVIGVIVGSYGAWYFSWLIGTVMLVLFAAAGGVLYEAQQKEREGSQHG